MAKFLIQLTYSDSALAELVKHPEDRGAAISELFARLGGKIEVFYYCFGDYDVVAIAEFPNNETMRAISFAARSTGIAKEHKITSLLSKEESVSALRRAGSADYHPPGG